MSEHLLSIILFTPLAGMFILLLIPSRRTDLIRLWANIAGFAGFAVSLPLLWRFDKNAAGFQLVERYEWIPSLGARYIVGIDGISLLLVLLTTLIGALAILSSWSAIQEKVKQYYAMFLLQQTGMLGVFLALDFFLFFVFWEVVLVPMYFIIGVWGGPRKLYAAIKFFLYTLAGSVLMLLGILTLYFQHFRQFGYYTFEIAELMKLDLPLGIQQWVFWAFFIGFAIKVPMFPFHTWLPDAHVEAPTAGSVILASILLKMGTYGFIRFSLPLLPKASIDPRIVKILVGLSLVAIVYGALVSLMQQDWKKLVAYSSVSHLGFCTLGIFALNPNGLAGSVIQQINHGISTGMLFLIVGIAYERRHTRAIAEYGGLAHVMPKYATVFAIAMLSSAGLPLLNGFIGEFTILQGAFEANRLWAAIASLGIILGAAYLLWLYQRTMLGQITNPKNLRLPDLNLRELAVFAPLIAWAIWIGVYPKPYFEVLEKPVAEILQRVRPEYWEKASALAAAPLGVLR
ncbi:MAG: NADH-quinone oxidoreductase subunit M [Bryobacterales bacterium]|nr:NADH-quinone oxidoreductase subunit M [Bryobacteraceae bacterium]MDW8130927.1 NADH-quinone oxidoreductase subunit M [Bryobacterales bacterium]